MKDTTRPDAQPGAHRAGGTWADLVNEARRSQSGILETSARRRGWHFERLLPGEGESVAFDRGYRAWWLEDDERFGPDPELERPHSTRWRDAYETGRVAAAATDRYDTERERQRRRGRGR
jgi:hypothetical protein